jgi:hypothetical protein
MRLMKIAASFRSGCIKDIGDATRYQKVSRFLERKRKAESRRLKYWEIIVNKIIKSGFSGGWVSALDDEGRTIWIVDAHREGTRFVVRADEKLTALLELERAIYEFAVSSIA